MYIQIKLIGRSGVQIPEGGNYFSLLKSDQLQGPFSLLVSLVVKWLGSEADHLPPYSAEVMNVWSFTSQIVTQDCELKVAEHVYGKLTFICRQDSAHEITLN